MELSAGTLKRILLELGGKELSYESVKEYTERKNIMIGYQITQPFRKMLLSFRATSFC